LRDVVKSRLSDGDGLRNSQSSQINKTTFLLINRIVLCVTYTAKTTAGEDPTPLAIAPLLPALTPPLLPPPLRSPPLPLPLPTSRLVSLIRIALLLELIVVGAGRMIGGRSNASTIFDMRRSRVGDIVRSVRCDSEIGFAGLLASSSDDGALSNAAVLCASKHTGSSSCHVLPTVAERNAQSTVQLA
jgi:hypothetical protein